MRKNLLFCFIMILFIYLLIFPIQALEASKEGLLLWFDHLLPTLLPFLILSQFILKTPVIYMIQKITGPLFKRIFHCSENGGFCILCGFLCGYPVGPRLIALQLKEHNINISEGQYLLSFCNNVSPSFCISYGMISIIGTKEILPYLICIYGSSLCLGLLMRPPKNSIQGQNTKIQTSSAENIFQLVDVCVIDSFLILIKLCGYLIIFSITCKALFTLLPDSGIFTALIYSLLEITGGLSYIGRLPKGTVSASLTVAALTFGGLCCIFQTNSVIQNTGLSIKKYIFHKVLNTFLALLFFFLWKFFF